jgi:hypothetical protein
MQPRLLLELFAEEAMEFGLPYNDPSTSRELQGIDNFYTNCKQITTFYYISLGENELNTKHSFEWSLGALSPIR